MNRPKKKGTAFETCIVRYMQNALNDKRIERRSLSGAADRGDIYGVYAHGLEGIVECKNHKKWSKADLRRWMQETLDECANADADFALLVVHKDRVGEKNAGQNLCYINILHFHKITGREEEPDIPDWWYEGADAIWMMLSLEDACKLLKTPLPQSLNLSSPMRLKKY